MLTSIPLQMCPHFALAVSHGVPAWSGHFLSLLSWQKGSCWGGAGIKEMGLKALVPTYE